MKGEVNTSRGRLNDYLKGGNFKKRTAKLSRKNSKFHKKLMQSS
jgi:hypothetical protein